MCLGSPKMPAPPPPPKLPPPPPTRDDPEINQAATDLRKRRLAAKGRSSTILTAATGVRDDANVGKTLLGG